MADLPEATAVPAMADHAANLVTHGRAMVEVEAQDHHRLAMVEAATPLAAADITAAEVVAVVIPLAEVVVVIPVAEAEATPAADIVVTARTRSAS